MKRALSLLLLASGMAVSAPALDREAFTVTRYQLDVQIDRASQVMAVTGKLTLRNDSKVPQKNAALQVSSSLRWNGIAIADQPAEWIGDDYTSDIDHTGLLSEAIVNLPTAVPSAGTIVLDVQFGGRVTADSTRLTRMGAPAELALRNDWDQISPSFTAVRGLGYVVWYPVSISAVSLSDGNAVVDAIAAWKRRHQQSTFHAHVSVIDEDARLCIAGTAMASTCGVLSKTDDPRSEGITNQISNDIRLSGLAQAVPAFAVAEYTRLERPGLALFYIRDQASVAQDYATAAEGNQSMLNEWLGSSSNTATVIALADPNANPYQSGSLLLAPLRRSQAATIEQLLIPVQVAARFRSPRPWIENGLQRFLQAINIERHSGRKSALQFLDEYRLPLVKVEEAEANPGDKENHARESAANRTLLNTADEILLQGKGSYVFWMLRDMIGDVPLEKALTGYRPESDTNPGYFQGLLLQNSARDLAWFFEDWVYQDPGLPEFRIDNVYARPQADPNKLYLVTITIENLGGVSAEVPVSIQTSSGERWVRMLVKARQKNSERTQLPAALTRVVVNDGSVPEVDPSNNTFDVPPKSEP